MINNFKIIYLFYPNDRRHPGRRNPPGRIQPKYLLIN